MKYFVDDAEVTLDELKSILYDWEHVEGIYGFNVIVIDHVEKDAIYFEKTEFD